MPNFSPLECYPDFWGRSYFNSCLYYPLFAMGIVVYTIILGTWAWFQTLRYGYIRIPNSTNLTQNSRSEFIKIQAKPGIVTCLRIFQGFIFLFLLLDIILILWMKIVTKVFLIPLFAWTGVLLFSFSIHHYIFKEEVKKLERFSWKVR